MPRLDPPAESALLCESCGYVLDPAGLSPAATPPDADARCPECGRPVADSLPNLRSLTPWDLRPTPRALVRTTIAAFRPGFFRSLRTRVPDDRQGRRLGLCFSAIAAATLAGIAHLHSIIVRPPGWSPLALPLTGLATVVLIVVILRLTTLLTVFEGRYRGLRLTQLAVARVLNHHLPRVALLFLAVAVIDAVVAILTIRDQVGIDVYLYTLASLVVVSGVVLFVSYWSAMKQILHANA